MQVVEASRRIIQSPKVRIILYLFDACLQKDEEFAFHAVDFCTLIWDFCAFISNLFP